jgi:phage N-6-adenine-methyltransferase|tara:strand:+ start:81 stop:593 length:513 start_codon:yes stop_codon:yes gene_type:complete
MESSPWNQGQLFSDTDKTGSEDWATPKDLFKAVNAEFRFDLDAAASAHNACVTNYIAKEEDALSVDWSQRGSAVWLNPPYGRSVKDWMRKAYEESLKGITVVVLVFARTDTAWWHEYGTKAAEARFIKGRLHFTRADGHTGASTAPSVLLVFDEKRRQPMITHIELPRGN